MKTGRGFCQTIWWMHKALESKAKENKEQSSLRSTSLGDTRKVAPVLPRAHTVQWGWNTGAWAESCPWSFPFPWESVPGWEVEPLAQFNDGEGMVKNCPEYKVSLQSPVAPRCRRLLAYFWLQDLGLCWQKFWIVAPGICYFSIFQTRHNLADSYSCQTGAHKTFIETSDQADHLIRLSPRELIWCNHHSERKWFLLHQSWIVLLQICSLAGLSDPFWEVTWCVTRWGVDIALSSAFLMR